MKWLLITDEKTLFDKINAALINCDKKNKLIQCDFSIENLKKQKKIFDSYAGCIIYSEKEASFSNDNIALIASINGYLAYAKIPLITNLKLILNNELFAKDAVTKADSLDEIISLLNKKYKKLVEASITRIAKNKLLDRGIPFTSDCFGTYIEKDKLEIVNEFLEAGMSINSRDDTGTPMLNIACRSDNFEFVQMFLELGADLNAVSEDRGYTAVMDAVWRGNEKITKFLIDQGAELNTINKEGQSNLILAVGANRENIVRLLAENGADPDVRDMMGMSAYNYATLFKKTRLVEILQPYHKG
ncbi:MAG: ankyrin repeat domain-containing protein [Treponema sp.]|nr:ankyrin repeat domain-containing protein [Treponema sp.]